MRRYIPASRLPKSSMPRSSPRRKQSPAVAAANSMVSRRHFSVRNRIRGCQPLARLRAISGTNRSLRE